VSQVLGAPLAAALLSLDGTAGLAGWQWVFLAEALPALILAGPLLLMLPPSIAAARFLDPSQAAALQRAVADSQARASRPPPAARPPLPAEKKGSPQLPQPPRSGAGGGVGELTLQCMLLAVAHSRVVRYAGMW
jgi:MFS family permease